MTEKPQRKVSLNKATGSCWVIVVVSILLTLLISYTILLIIPSLTSSNIHPSTASYVIDTDGTNTWAIRDDGYIVYQGTDAVSIMQKTINDMSTGECLTLKAETYKISSTLILNKTIHFQGEGFYAEFIPSPGFLDLFIQITEDDVVLSNILINGYGSPTRSGISIESNNNILFNVKVQGMEGPDKYGIRISNWTQELYSVNLMNNVIGLKLVEGANNVNIFAGTFYSNSNNSKLIYLEGGATTHIYGTNFEGNKNETTGIHINYFNSQIYIFGGRFETLLTGINWTTGSNDRIVSSSFANITNKIVNLPATSKIIDCPSMITKNLVSGTNSTSSIFELAHGLSGKADYVFCSFNTTKVTGYSWTSNSTHITVTIAGSNLPASITCYADVRYEP